jgi:hypothetical protein
MAGKPEEDSGRSPQATERVPANTLAAAPARLRKSPDRKLLPRARVKTVGKEEIPVYREWLAVSGALARTI